MPIASTPLHPLLQLIAMAALIFGPGLFLARRVECRAERLAWAFVWGSFLLFLAALAAFAGGWGWLVWAHGLASLMCLLLVMRRPDSRDLFWLFPLIFSAAGAAVLAASPAPGLITMGLGDSPSFYRLAQNLAEGRGPVNDVWIGDYNGQYLLPGTFPFLSWVTAFFFRLFGVNPWSMEVFLVLAAVPVLGLLARLVDHREKLRPWLAGSLGALVFVHPFYSVALFVGVQTTTTALAALLVFRVLERGFYPAALLVAAWSALSSPVGVFLLAALVLAAPVFLARPWWRGVVYGALGLAAAFVGGSLFLDQAGPLFGGTFFLQKFRHVGSQFVAPGPQTFVVSNVMSTVGLPGFLQSWPPWIPGQILSHPVSLLAYLVEVLYVAGGYMMKVFIPGAVGILILGGRRNFSWSLGILAVAAVSLLFLAASNPVIFPRHHLAVGLWVLIPLGRLLLWMPTRGGLPVLLALFGFLRTAATAEGGLHHRARPENTNHAGFSRLLAPHVEPGALVMGTYPQMYAFLLSRPAAGATLLCSSQALMDAYLNKYRPQWLILDDFRPELKNLSLCRDRKIRIPAEWREFPVPGAEHFSAKAYRRDASAVNTRQSLPANTTSFPGGFRKSAGEKR